jgi:mono/diheme cytochrome c family protein
MHKTLLPLALPALAASLLEACDVHRPWPGLEPSLERMMVQPRAAAYQTNATFANGQVMRPIPEGAIPYGHPESGASSASLRAEPIPFAITEDVLHEGRRNFETICATCHGILGDGDSAVADRMALRKPPSLHEPRIRREPPGDYFDAISGGYGLMPAYAIELSEHQRWAVVAYVEALQMSFDAHLSELPPSVREEAERELR